MRVFLCVLCVLCGEGFSPLLFASGLGQLKTFLSETHAAHGSFTQTVIARSGRKPQQSSGTFSFARPGKFRWLYEKPYEQLLVGDGEKFWSFDRDLNQVTVKKIGQAFGSSPAALLAGEALEKNFELKEADGADGLEFVEARPKAEDATFKDMRVGFRDGLPQAMEIHDNFGQTTLLRFTKFDANPSLPSGEFRFTPPKGADIVGE
jgi:outer membrane lipoprotein carrier protein